MIQRKGPAKQVAEDVIDSCFEYQRVYHEWPRSWRRYVHGMRHIGREVARSNLQDFNVQQLVKASNPSEIRGWVAEQTIKAEWR